MKKIVALLSVVLMMSSCTEEIKTNTPAFQAQFGEEVWRAKTVRVTPNENGGITITALTNYEQITLNTSSANAGTYYFGSTNADDFATYSFETDSDFGDYDTSIYEGPVYKIAGVVNPGSNYIQSNNALTTGGSGSGLKVATVTGTAGTITDVNIVSRGDGYKAGDVVTIVGGDNNATIRVLNVQQSNGEIIIEKIENGTYTGTFKFSAVDELGEVVTFSQGVFYKAPLQ